MTNADKSLTVGFMVHVGRMANVRASKVGKGKSVTWKYHTWIDYGELSMDYVELGPYELLRGMDGNAVTFYNRPAYAKVTVTVGCLSDKRYTIFLYTGRRWYDTEWCDEDPSHFFEKNDYLHTYWDNILEGRTYFFSEASTSVSGTNLAMFEVAFSVSKLRHAAFPDHTPIKSSYECVDVGCQKDKAVCGAYGDCTPSPDNTTSTCLCNSLFGGRRCQFDPEESYAEEQYYSLRNGTFIQNEYADFFWDHQKKWLNYLLTGQLPEETLAPSP